MNIIMDHGMALTRIQVGFGSAEADLDWYRLGTGPRAAGLGRKLIR
jgi:hypothetical protein